MHVIAVGRRLPDWAESASADYARRVAAGWSLRVQAVPVSRRSSSDAGVRRREEGDALLRAAPDSGLLVALDAGGESWDSAQLAARLDDWHRQWRDAAFLIGGPDGLSAECLARAALRWSLSPLTLPHALARVLVSEQLYRAWSVLQGHPYHR